MSWRAILSQSEIKSLPYIGSRTVCNSTRAWTIQGKLPSEFGWYGFNVGGTSKTSLVEDVPCPPDPGYDVGFRSATGYLVGDRFIDEDASPPSAADEALDKYFKNTERVFLVEPGLDRFARIRVIKTQTHKLIFIRQEFPRGPEDEINRLYQDKVNLLGRTAGVAPALHLALRLNVRQRAIIEERRAKLETERLERERVDMLMQQAGTAAGRRILASINFDEAATSALRVSGAEFLEARASFRTNEVVVQFRFRQQRFECVVEKSTLRIIDAGICLQDHKTGEKGDTYFTLESLPSVIGEAMDRDVLHIWRHVDD